MFGPAPFKTMQWTQVSKRGIAQYGPRWEHSSLNKKIISLTYSAHAFRG